VYRPRRSTRPSSASRRWRGTRRFTPTKRQAVEAHSKKAPLGSGVLTIKNMQLGHLVADQYPSIEGIKFTVTLKLPVRTPREHTGH
jgi:hypothetical protein